MNRQAPADTARRSLLAAALAGCGMAWAQPAAARWPAAPIRILPVCPAGGVSDGIVRVLAEQLALSLATPVQVEYRPSAGGSLGLVALREALPAADNLSAGGSSAQFAALIRQAQAQHRALLQRSPIKLD